MASRGLSRRAARTTASRRRAGDVRAWAKDHGIAVSSRGRIPARVAEQYHAATTGRWPGPGRAHAHARRRQAINQIEAPTAQQPST